MYIYIYMFVCVRASSVLWPQHEGFEIQNVSLEWENRGILSLNSLHSFADVATLWLFNTAIAAIENHLF